MNVAGGSGFSRTEIFMLVARLSFVTAIGFFSMKYIMNQLDPNNKQKRKAKKKVPNRSRGLLRNCVSPLVALVWHNLAANYSFSFFSIRFVSFRFFTHSYPCPECSESQCIACIYRRRNSWGSWLGQMP